MKAFLAAAVLLVVGQDSASAFTPSSRVALPITARAPSTADALRMVATSTDADAKDYTADDDDQSNLTSKGLLKRDRYLATNRFAVRPGKEAKFEARWANRKSRLATLDGFRYFHLMRRVDLDDDGTQSYDGGDKSDGSNAGNYVSFTIWDKKSHFSSWRNGEAFKEAHGGTSIGAFLSTMVNSALVLKGAPRPAFYDGLLVQSIVPDSIPETVDGWRSIEGADGQSVLPAECFVACNQFYVPAENAAAFEKRWADRESKLKECDGFVAFGMMRRDGQQKGHGTVPMAEGEPSYLSTTVWRDREAFEGWREGNNFRAAHAQKKDGAGEKPPQAPPQWTRPPSPVFYEGTLVISSEEGA